MRTAPRRLQWATAFFLTDLASGMRLCQQDVIKNTMVIRDRAFVDRHLVFQRANGRSPIDAQIARAGSYASPRFSGWVEQVEVGNKPRTAALKARAGGTSRGKMVGKVRLRPGNKFLTPKSITPMGMQSEAHRTFVFLLIMARRAKVPFILTSGSTQPGVWTLDGRHGKRRGDDTVKGKGPRLRQLQHFGADEKVKKNDWNASARDLLLQHANIKTVWARCWDRADVLPKKKVCK